MAEANYTSPRGVEAGIREAARAAFRHDPSITVSDRIRQEYYRRFLSRIFSDIESAEWILKGGTGVLARVASARATRDVDLFRRGTSLEFALTELRRMAAVDLDDFFRFEYVSHADGIGGTQQQLTEGCQVSFDIYIGASRRGTLSIDLVVHAIMTDEPTVMTPANSLKLPKLQSFDYLLYPVVDQIADKVCATLTIYNGKSSSREWDLVDLVILATTEHVEADKLVVALHAEALVRSLALPREFAVPESWGARYAKDAKPVPACADYSSVESATALMQAFLDPILQGLVPGYTWAPKEQKWRLASGETTNGAAVAEKQIQGWAAEVDAGYDLKKLKLNGRGRPGPGPEQA